MTAISRYFHLKFWALVLALPLICGTLCAEEVIESLEVQDFLGKKVYTNVRVIDVTEKGLKISHDAGLSVIPFKALPPEMAARYKPAETAPLSNSAPMTTPEVAVNADVGAAKVVNEFDPACLVFFTVESFLGVSSTGSGFIMEQNGKTYVYTNAHVLCGEIPQFTKRITRIQTGTGKVIPVPYELELSDTGNGLEDIARFLIALKAGEAAYRMAELDASQYVDSDVIAYGNSLGADVMTTLNGKIVALGTDRFEVSCEIVPGNSGGPIVLGKTKEVIGISTYLLAPRTGTGVDGTSLSGIRRFALRPEKVTAWRRMQTTSLFSALDEMNGFFMDSVTLLAACYVKPRSGYRGLDVESSSVGQFNTRQVIIDGRSRTLGAAINGGIAKVNQRLGASGASVAGNYASAAYGEFFSSVATTSNSQISNMQTASRAPYLKKFFGDLITFRKVIHSLFVQHSAQFRF